MRKPDLSPEPPLTALALLAAGGELEGEQAAAFERRLARDQDAREALARAVQLSQSFANLPPALPDPTYRDRVRQRLLPRRGLWHTLPHARSLPVLTALAGAAAALLLSLWLSRSPVAVPTADDAETPVAGPEEGPTLHQARIWTELQNSDHLSRALEEKKRRRGRTDEPSPVQTEYRSWHLLNQSSIKH
jgi:hypothetical protein